MPILRFSFLALSVLLAMPAVGQATSPPIVYVWDFSDRDGKEDDLTRSLTEEFEEALIKTDCCTVLQRRTYARIFQQRENEKSILSLSNLSRSTVQDLEAKEANTVVLGQVHDDTKSGQLKISVSFEKFSGLIEKTASVYMAKYDVNNPKKRVAAISELIDELKLEPTGDPIDVKPIDEWEFALIGCERIGKNVKCSVTVKSNYRDRNYKSYPAKAFDEYGYEYRSRTQQLANKSGGNISTLLIDGIKASGFIIFENVSSRAYKFPLLELDVRGDDLSTTKIQFRDVKIK
jgi:hypothetical protein